jgi:anti-sigma B factor antagonist
MGEGRGLRVSVIAEGADTMVRVSGELDLATAPELERALDGIQAPAGRVVLDLRELSFSDAIGLRVIEAASRRLGERLIVFGTRPPVRHLFEVTHLDQLVAREAAPAPASDVALGNLAYVRRLWEGFSRGGTSRVAEMVPDGAEWRPLRPGGEALRGGEGVSAFWGAGQAPASFAALGDDVLVGVRIEDGDQVWSLFWFDDRRLLGAATFEHRAEALAAHRLRRGS